MPASASEQKIRSRERKQTRTTWPGRLRSRLRMPSLALGRDALRLRRPRLAG